MNRFIDLTSPYDVVSYPLEEKTYKMMHIHCASINVIFDEYSMCCNEKENSKESSL
jgi:hypothetical protein